jgi:hypothetical protein
MTMQRDLAKFAFGGAARRWIAMLCVSLFVYSGYAHSACGLQPCASEQAIQASTDIAHDTSDTPATPSLDGSHCHGCAAVAVPMVAQALVIGAIVTKPAMTATDELLASDRQFDPPPPKT